MTKTVTHPPALNALAPVTAGQGVEAALRAALERSVIALDDWLNLYASEFCNADRVAEAKARTNENGTLWYIATIQEANRAALAQQPPKDTP